MVGPEAAASAGAEAGLTAAPGRGLVVAPEASAFKMNLLQIVRDHWVHILVPVGFVVGCYLDRRNDEKLIAFRNKSLLYKRLVFVFFY
uniref:NADH dehydrogenase [ubiquinone] 1 beta subcomplex subunit 1 n=1 Tax=Balaenoptera musculus TaxID=9771 RepID=A0A8C0HSR7_BALMU